MRVSVRWHASVELRCRGRGVHPGRSARRSSPGPPRSRSSPNRVPVRQRSSRVVLLRCRSRGAPHTEAGANKWISATLRFNREPVEDLYGFMRARQGC
eukprot:552481-Prymnesium_polylepis.1